MGLQIMRYRVSMIGGALEIARCGDQRDAGHLRAFRRRDWSEPYDRQRLSSR